jgi:hypothetical protein
MEDSVIRCRQCLTKAEPRDGLCPVCGIVQEKNGRTLSPSEAKVRFHARCIRLVAMFHLLGAALGLLLMSEFPSQAVSAALVAANLFLAFGLVRYSLIAYRAATVYYFLIGMVNVISIQHGIEHLAGIALALIALYLVGNGTAKAIFERRLPV